MNACKKETTFQENLRPTLENVRYPKTPEEIQIAKRSEELTEILKKVFQNRDALAEVNAAIASGFYRDELVAIKDLVYPNESRLFKSDKFKRLNVHHGIFEKEFKKFSN